MEKQKKERVERTAKILAKLDEKSLLIIESGAGLLLARQKMETKKGE